MKKLSKKSVVIILAIILCLGFVVYFIFKGDVEQKKLHCSFENNNFSLANYSVEFDVYYTTPSAIDKTEGTIDFTFNEKELLEYIDYIEGSVKSYYEELAKSEAVDIDVQRNGDNLVVDYVIDYKFYDPNDANINKLLPVKDDREMGIPSVNSIKESIEKSGGVCFEE